MFKEIVFGIDFDGTCVKHCFPEVGEDCPGAVGVLKWIIANGGKLVLNTMRSDSAERLYLSEAQDWFIDRDIPLYGVNENPTQKAWTKSPKVYAHIYIDDAALGCPLSSDGINRPYVDWHLVQHYLKSNFLKAEPIINGKHIVTE